MLDRSWLVGPCLVVGLFAASVHRLACNPVSLNCPDPERALALPHIASRSELPSFHLIAASHRHQHSRSFPSLISFPYTQGTHTKTPFDSCLIVYGAPLSSYLLFGSFRHIIALSNTILSTYPYLCYPYGTSTNPFHESRITIPSLSPSGRSLLIQRSPTIQTVPCPSVRICMVEVILPPPPHNIPIIRHHNQKSSFKITEAQLYRWLALALSECSS
jgi:hypothetical protein